jgi:two-component system, NtrC family, sensor kinase
MDKNLQTISDFIHQDPNMPAEQKESVLKALKDVDKELQILTFKLDRTEKVKRTTAILLEETIEELEQKRKAVEETLTELKATQAQLIQSEKMASLGELTAGIAHEIQNPLNFVNNFSEVSGELIDEMEEELKAGNSEIAIEIAGDLKQNLAKINHHGQRASSIVKGMLEHSRTSTGKKEPTDINALCDEYLRLSYHGLRAKDKSFNATFETFFDPDLPKIDIIPQDIGRVLLNLINNAFYAVAERSRSTVNARKNLLDLAEPSSDENLKDFTYKPKVTITTKLIADSQLQIAIKDNGSGIPDAIKDKIFQPFFTTKPTGHGTGLGLSLAYDIVKAHGGELSVESYAGPEIKNRECSTKFTIALPL